MKTYTCEACGAKLLVSEISHVSTCLYCGNTIVIHNEQIDNLNIQKMIPFSIEKEEAIKKVKQLVKDKIVDAKKVYVPVKFSNYHYDYLFYFEYKIKYEDENGGTYYRYYDADILLDGEANKEIVFGSSKVNNIYMNHEYRNEPVIDYNPALIQDVSIEIANFDYVDVPKQQEERLKEYAQHYFSHYNINKVYSENYFLSNSNVDAYTTLIPVYVVKTERGEIYNVPGIKVHAIIDPAHKMTNKIVISAILLAILSVITGLPQLIVPIFIIGLISAIIVSNKSKYTTFEGYQTKEIKFSPKRKRLK